MEYWKRKSSNELRKALDVSSKLNLNRAKNVIIFVGDGMSLPTLTAARIYKAQKEVHFDGSVRGEESLLFFEQLPHVGLSRVRIF